MSSSQIDFIRQDLAVVQTPAVGKASLYIHTDGAIHVKDETGADNAVASSGTVNAAIAAHEAASDPHPGYQRESEKGLANGYCDLDAGGKVPTARIPGLDAGQVTNTPAGSIAATTVQAAINELDGEKAAKTAVTGAPTLTAGTETANAIQVTIQAKDASGADLSARVLMRVLIADSQWGGEASAAPSGGVAIDTGQLWQTITAGKQFVILSNGSGQVQLTLTESTAKTFWVHGEHAGRVAAASVAFA